MSNSNDQAKPPLGMIAGTYCVGLLIAAILGGLLYLPILGINALLASPFTLGWSGYLVSWLAFAAWIFYPNQKSWVLHLKDPDGNVFEVLGRNPD